MTTDTFILASVRLKRYLDRTTLVEVQAAEQNGHELYSQGCHLFRCRRCNSAGYLDDRFSGQSFGEGSCEKAMLRRWNREAMEHRHAASYYNDSECRGCALLRAEDEPFALWVAERLNGTKQTIPLKWKRDGDDWVAGSFRIVPVGETGAGRRYAWGLMRNGKPITTTVRGREQPKVYDRVGDAKKHAEKL